MHSFETCTLYSVEFLFMYSKLIYIYIKDTYTYIYEHQLTKII
jgi:hypothetical protein